MNDIERIQRALRCAADVLEGCELDMRAWEGDYIWSLPVADVFVSASEPPDVLVTQISDELGFLDSAIEDDPATLVYMLTKVADVTRACSAAVRPRL